MSTPSARPAGRSAVRAHRASRRLSHSDHRTSRGDRRERGSASVLATVLAGALLAATALLSAVGAGIADQRRAAAAADLSALAGASAVQRGEPGCAAARSVAARNHARVTSCSVVGEVVTVRTARPARRVLGVTFTVRSRARAGPSDLER